MLFLIHGGPQGAWGETWTYRWNAQVFAAAGYLVVMPNPRGSTGYGQKFIDEINGDWGGKPYDDIMAVVDSVAALKYVDPDRMAAAGGSYGGYMVDWMLGHTTRFKALVSHDGVFDLRSMAASTEELWFPMWEFKGMPWDNPDMYARWSPSYFVKDFKTPTLVIHGEEDYRVPLEQGLQLFTALQMQKVPSKLLVFPNEGHWVLKPQDSVLWYQGSARLDRGVDQVGQVVNLRPIVNRPPRRTIERALLASAVLALSRAADLPKRGCAKRWRARPQGRSNLPAGVIEVSSELVWRAGSARSGNRGGRNGT